MIRGALFTFLFCGCVSEFHPEYHPVSIVSVEQRLPTYAAPEPDYTKLFPVEKRDVDPFVVAAPIPEATVAPTPRRGGVYIGDGVRINGNVVINGDVYITTSR